MRPRGRVSVARSQLGTQTPFCDGFTTWLVSSTMCQYAEHVGATLGCVVDAMAKEAMAMAFCLSTDATGIAIQPARLPDRKRQACAKGHFFVVLADKDHVFFEYQPKHTSDAVCKPPDEVACWSHARRKAWEAAVVTKEPAAREALLRIQTLFQLEEDWAHLAPKQRHERRQRITRPMLDEFFAWAEGVFERVRGVRGPVAIAFVRLRHPTARRAAPIPRRRSAPHGEQRE